MLRGDPSDPPHGLRPHDPCFKVLLQRRDTLRPPTSRGLQPWLSTVCKQGLNGSPERGQTKPSQTSPAKSFLDLEPPLP